MQELAKLLDQMMAERPVRWEQMPDIPLYMDQIVGYMSRQLIDFGQGDKLTAAMINNYIKDGMLPRADGKRYNQEHIGYLTVICVLKQILSVRDAKVLMGETLASLNIKEFYEEFCNDIDGSLGESLTGMTADMSREEMTAAALHLAISAYSRQLVCKRLIGILSDDTKKTSPGNPPVKDSK